MALLLKAGPDALVTMFGQFRTDRRVAFAIDGTATFRVEHSHGKVFQKKSTDGPFAPVAWQIRLLADAGWQDAEIVYEQPSGLPANIYEVRPLYAFPS
ncbi:hypothetical protein RCDURKIN_9 [Rhodobacter phage RcDurkin]|nr:hypothetical protein RCDURKIN_9 [Rhodobacter phage RcDurkin]